MMEGIGERIEQANQDVVRRILAGDPVWEDVRPAREVIPGMTENTILHAGPPIGWQRMAGPMRGAIMAALMFEGRARTPEEAVRAAESGELNFSPCHEHRSVGAMAGVISPSMPVFVVRNAPFGNVAYCGWRDLAQASGCFDGTTLKNMGWLRDVGMPALSAAVRRRGGLELKPLWARALTMGDELHNRVSAGTSIFARALAPHLVRAFPDISAVAEVLDYLADFDLAIVPLTMAGCKSILDAAQGREASTVVTAIARNGVEVGIRVSGLGGRLKGRTIPGSPRRTAVPTWGIRPSSRPPGSGGARSPPLPPTSPFAMNREQPMLTPVKCTKSPWQKTRATPSLPWDSRELPPASISARSWRRESSPSSTLRWLIGNRDGSGASLASACPGRPWNVF
jgi:hypothetical protein